MNYYEHHLGDYLKATTKLSMIEDGAYRRLLDTYYCDEQPIPVDDAFKAARAFTRHEKDAVKEVLKRFFRVESGTYVHDRAEAEIERYRIKSGKAKASANARWNKERGLTSISEEECARNADAYANACQTHDERICSSDAHQSPVTSIKGMDSSVGAAEPKQRAARPAKKCPENFVVSDDLRAWAAEKTPGVNVNAEAEKFMDYTFKNARTDWDATFRSWMRKAFEVKGDNVFSMQSGVVASRRFGE